MNIRNVYDFKMKIENNKKKTKKKWVWCGNMGSDLNSMTVNGVVEQLRYDHYTFLDMTAIYLSYLENK